MGLLDVVQPPTMETLPENSGRRWLKTVARAVEIVQTKLSEPTCPGYLSERYLGLKKRFLKGSQIVECGVARKTMKQ